MKLIISINSSMKQKIANPDLSILKLFGFFPRFDSAKGFESRKIQSKLQLKTNSATSFI
jgi:hypothetical protein